VNGALETGTELGGYRITGMLGRGGMGFVYEAEHKLLRKKAALKTLTPELAGGEEFRERFIREAQTVAAIDHPNIIPIYDAADVDGLVYIAMRFVKGPDLEKLIENAGALEPHQALGILEQVAGALDAAHAYDIVHRDVKPPNVMIEDGSGRIYLMDFGIAKRRGTAGMTVDGSFVGTVDYAAPEQIEAKEITVAADVYAFGGVLYESLTGQKPYPRDADFQVMFAHMTEPPPKVTAVKPGLPEDLDAVIAKAMAKAPEDRYATCREMVDAARAALGESVSAGRAAAIRVAEPEPAAAALASNLPVPASPLVGRDTELDAVLTLVRRDDVRLVTLSGLGGTGKTRLALEAARTLEPEFAAALFVDLAPVQDPTLVGSAITDVLGVREAPDKPITETIAERLGDAPTLLLLDNFEQVAPAASLVGELLAAAPALKVIVTSRMLLRVRGEREYPVPPLEVPAGGAASAESGAVRLFVDRAQEAKPSFELTDENLEAVAEICRRLEGIPLAIELAAARVKLLTPQQIRARLEEKRLSFLAGATSGGTLREAIEWSYHLLDDNGKALFARLGVFVGGTSLEGAEAIAGQPLGLEFGEVLDLIAQLVDNSLVRQSDGADGEPRFRMLETIREYALERLSESGQLEDARNQHLQRYLQLAERAEPELVRAGQAAWLERLTEENDNIRAALAWSFDSGQVGDGLRLAGALVRFWSYRGLITEGRRWLTDALGAATGTEARILAKAYYAAGFAALGQGDYPQAKPFFEESLVLARQAGDVRQEAAALQQIGWIVMTRGRYEPSHGIRARQLAGKALDLAREIGDKLIQSGALNILAEVAAEEGDEATATELYGQSLTLRREIGDRRLIANSVLTLGRNEVLRGNYERATQLLNEGLTLAQELRDTWSMSLALVGLARVALLSGGDVAEAERLFGEGLALAKERGDKRVAAECLQGLGAVLGTQGDAARAARLFGAAEALLESLSATPSANEVAIAQQFVPPVQAALGEEQLDVEWKAGRAMSPDEAIALALAVASDATARVAAAI
jgi:non-specific serine/threonine protein kinase